VQKHLLSDPNEPQPDQAKADDTKPAVTADAGREPVFDAEAT
jgi:hypothetical protein